jgi:hypothetical protein
MGIVNGSVVDGSVIKEGREEKRKKDEGVVEYEEEKI